MTIDEAIIHCEEVADRCAITDGDRRCEQEHRQLAEWLKELKRYQWISVEDRLPEKRQVVLAIGEGSKTWDVGMFKGLSPSNNNHVWWWKKNTVKRVDYWMPKGAVQLPWKE